jgi:hypothetical protein
MILPPKNAPRDSFPREVLATLPLAEAFYTLWGYLATDDVLHDLFRTHRGPCYTDTLTFPQLVALLIDALTRYHGSGQRAITKALERNQLEVKGRAPYGKLSRVPIPLAEAFLSRLAARLRPLFPTGLCRTELPACLSRFSVVVLDGKKIKNAAKRLRATRGRPGKLFGGKILAAYLPADGLVVAMAADPDGEANDLRLMPRVLPLARAAVAGLRLWVADAQFCDLDRTAEFTADGDHFVMRFTQRNGFTVDRNRPAQTGINRQGQRYREEWGWMGAAHDPRRRYLRRLVVKRPGQETVMVVTDLLDATAYPAVDLLAVYLERWQIENVFQQITEVFELQHLIGSAPQATVFQTSLCLMIYNVLQVVRGYAAQAASVAPATLSTEKIFVDLHEELLGLHRVLQGDDLWAVLPQESSAAAVQKQLEALLARAWTPQWKKAPPSKKAQPQRPKAQQSGAHTSVHKILQEARRQRTKAPIPAQIGKMCK